MSSKFPIVGIGASAGGVEALESFFRPMPDGTGMAFVVITHMPREHESALAGILGRVTPMASGQAEKDQEIEPNHVYVAPAGAELSVENGRFRLEPRRASAQPQGIDVFFSSLAQDQGEQAIAVVLSGGGSDGTLGIKAVKEAGGLTLAQGVDGSAPRHASMPETAIASGLVDLVLPVEKMAGRLVDFVRHSDKFDGVIALAPAVLPTLAENRKAICELLLKQVGHDFSGYKEASFMRRVRRRMQIVNIADLDDYIRLLRASAEEVKHLFRDLLIGVTHFFRDKDAFATLEQLVVPKLFEGAGAADVVRVWVPGCATGEEAYSIAILLREQIEKIGTRPKIQIFASDIDDAALNVARSGSYPLALVAGVSPQRLERFFTRNDGTYTVTREVRDSCVFSSHNILSNAPFSRIDLVSCRNLLIYLGPEFQGRVVPIFHFALKPNGFLFLGTSENITQHTSLFRPVDKKYRVFQRRDVAAPLPNLPGFAASRRFPGEGIRYEPDHPQGHLRKAVETRVLESFAPPHVVIDEDGTIVHYSARTGTYLEAASGLPTRHVLSLARASLKMDLRAAIEEARQTRRRAVRKRAPVRFDGDVQPVDIIVEPLDAQDDRSLFLVLFEDAGPRAPSPPEHRDDDQAVLSLERELAETRERLQSTIEEYESTVEELKAANEEMVSVNEELQSSNEELETSKEELQSINEELHTVNAELNRNIDELDRANSDLRNLFENTEIATVFLDKDLIVRSFTPAAKAIFRLIPSDRGRPLTDVSSRVDLGEFARDIAKVLGGGAPIERDVAALDRSAQYFMRLLPYRSAGDQQDGVIATFVDVTRIKEGEERQRTLINELNHRVRNMLGVVSAIANQTLATNTEPKEFARAFLGRIQALARAYSLISREGWGDVALKSVLLDVLEPYSEARVSLDGPPVLLKPRGALGFGLIAHELATNAVKYGALAGAEGRIEMSWREAGGALVLRWREAHGRRMRKAKKQGFGTKLIELEIKALHGKVEVDYAAGGLTAVLTLPMDPVVMTVAEDEAVETAGAD